MASLCMYFSPFRLLSCQFDPHPDIYPFPGDSEGEESAYKAGDVG